MPDQPNGAGPFQEKQRIIQEFVPGKQVTLAHIIANPNPDIYKRLIEMYGLIPEHCVFIDDTWRNLPMAEHFGIRTIRYTTQKETEEALLALTGKA